MVKMLSPWLTLVASFLETPHLHDEYHAPLEREWFGESVCLIASL